MLRTIARRRSEAGELVLLTERMSSHGQRHGLQTAVAQLQLHAFDRQGVQEVICPPHQHHHAVELPDL